MCGGRAPASTGWVDGHNRPHKLPYILTDPRLLAAVPLPQVSFTGHSLGGSLSTLLMLMYVRRGVLPISACSPVYTFGAPAVFCEGGARGGSCACRAGSSSGADGCSGVLQALGLPEGAIRCALSSGQWAVVGLGCAILRDGILHSPHSRHTPHPPTPPRPTHSSPPSPPPRNVLMSFDIVPRAFACDYSLVADLLKRVSDAFREHACLSGDRAVSADACFGATVVHGLWLKHVQLLCV